VSLLQEAFCHLFAVLRDALLAATSSMISGTGGLLGDEQMDASTVLPGNCTPAVLQSGRGAAAAVATQALRKHRATFKQQLSLGILATSIR